MLVNDPDSYCSTSNIIPKIDFFVSNLHNRLKYVYLSIDNWNSISGICIYYPSYWKLKYEA